MKDLITCMGSLMILMVFVMQFASNQVMITKFAASDYIVEEYQKNIHENTESQDDLKKRLSSFQTNTVMTEKQRLDTTTTFLWRT